MSSTIISEPFQLYLGSASAQKIPGFEAIYTTHNPNFPGYATVTAQSDGIHVWDVSKKSFYSAFATKSDNTSAAPEPPSCSFVFRGQACQVRSTCFQSVCHRGREQVGYQLHTPKTFPGRTQNTSRAYHLGNTTKHFRRNRRSKREDCCNCTLFLPSRSNDLRRRHLRLISHLFEYVVPVMTRYRCYSFQKMEVSSLPTCRWI